MADAQQVAAEEPAGRLFFIVADTDFPVVEKAARDRRGVKLQLDDGLPEGEPPEVFLDWRSARRPTWVRAPAAPPDVLNTLSGNLYVSERVRAAWNLQDGDATLLVPLRLRGRFGRVLKLEYWWVKIRNRAAILDEARTKGTRVGEIYHGIESVAVRWDRVPDAALFRCDELYSLVVTRPRVDAARAAGLTGAFFQDVHGGRWPPKEPS